MHNNYYFLRQLSQQLDKLLKGTVVSECYSQSKEELIIRFETTSDPFFIKASLLSSFSCVTFPVEFHRAKKNSIDLFPHLIGQRVQSVTQFENERAFAINFTNDFQLLFKLHGNRSNLVLFQNEIAVEIFKKSLKADTNIQLQAMNRMIDWSYEKFIASLENLPQTYFTLGQLSWRYFESNGFANAGIETKWTMLLQLKDLLESPSYHISNIEGKPVLSLIPFGEIRREYDNPLQAINDFYYTFTNVFALQNEKQSLLSVLNSRLASGKNYLLKTTAKLGELQHDNNYKVWADIIMANLHRISPGQEKAVLENLYDEGKPVTIKLKPTLSPQKNAEALYRKAKNQQIEIDHVTKAINEKQRQLADLEETQKTIGRLTELKKLRDLKKDLQLSGKHDDDIITLPYFEFEKNGFRILVGKNAESNDVLTLKHTYKNDLWLHAKDVAGSHVIIKYQSGKKFPKEVIERAAQLAAYNSKRKTDTLCPVIVTPKKFVRKRKGDPPGAVIVEREEVIMVVPKLGE
ncbi:MAG TPA: NFACT RNA binding domain-containing protein [Chryseosolibacter sp.]|nr:NFACT RNA binding domain-containing protein [Chryseosolibacter sp.]